MHKWEEESLCARYCNAGGVLIWSTLVPRRAVMMTGVSRMDDWQWSIGGADWEGS